LVYDKWLKIHHSTSKAKAIYAYDQGLTPLEYLTLICISKEAYIFFVTYL